MTGTVLGSDTKNRWYEHRDAVLREIGRDQPLSESSGVTLRNP